MPNLDSRENSTYVKPVERFMPARMVETRKRERGLVVEGRREEVEEEKRGGDFKVRTQDGVKAIVDDSSELSPETKS